MLNALIQSKKPLQLVGEGRVRDNNSKFTNYPCLPMFFVGARHCRAHRLSAFYQLDRSGVIIPVAQRSGTSSCAALDRRSPNFPPHFSFWHDLVVPRRSGIAKHPSAACGLPDILPKRVTIYIFCWGRLLFLPNYPL